MSCCGDLEDNEENNEDDQGSAYKISDSGIPQRCSKGHLYSTLNENH